MDIQDRLDYLLGEMEGCLNYAGTKADEASFHMDIISAIDPQNLTVSDTETIEDLETFYNCA